MDPLRVAVIGAGRICEQHLRALQHIEAANIISVCDLSPALSHFTAQRFAIPAWSTDYREILAAGPLDVVHVLTPPATHYRIVRDCLENKAHVIVEKPLALSNEAFRQLWHLAASSNLYLIENHNYRFNSPTQQLERAIAAGRIGTVEEVEVRMVLNLHGAGRYADENLPHPSHQLPAGVLHEFITHLAYLFLHFMPPGSLDTIETMHGAWRNHGGGNLFKYDDLDAIILTKSAHGRIRISSREWPDCLSLFIRGSRGQAEAELFHPFFRIATQRALGKHFTPLLNSLAHSRALIRSGFGGIWRKLRNRGAYEGLDRFLELSYQAIQSGAPAPVGYSHMDGASRLVDALLVSDNPI